MSAASVNVARCRGLSELQAAILRHVLRKYQHLEVHGDAYEHDELSYWGAPWRPGTRSASERAAVSRSLRRLESRGLVRRRNQRIGDRYHDGDDPRLPPVTRTTEVKLTPPGRLLAERLTNGEMQVVNRVSGNVAR